MARPTQHEHWSSTTESRTGSSLDGPSRILTSDPAANAVDIEQLLVRQGWVWLRSRVIGCVHEITIGTTTRRANDQRRLTPREFQVAALSARGLMAKEIGSELAIAEATARGTLSRSLMKLGLTKGTRLVSTWNALMRPARRFSIGTDQTALVFMCELVAPEATESLTSSERAILANLLEGRSNRAISHQRGTSERTVANQVAILLRKFRASTRRELSAKVLRGAQPMSATADLDEQKLQAIPCGPPPLHLTRTAGSASVAPSVRAASTVSPVTLETTSVAAHR